MVGKLAVVECCIRIPISHDLAVIAECDPTFLSAFHHQCGLPHAGNAVLFALHLKNEAEFLERYCDRRQVGHPMWLLWPFENRPYGWDSIDRNQIHFDDAESE